MFTTLIVDDEQPQQELLKGFISKDLPQLQLLAVCSSVEEGVSRIKALQPQLVFLDVVMPPKTGFDLLAEIRTINFEVIFTTSYEHYALKAFKASAVDYLLKPFGLTELSAAVKKFEDKIASQRTLNHIHLLMENIKDSNIAKARIALPALSGYLFVKVSDIVRCESDNVYTTFFMADKSAIVVTKKLKECEELLADYNFCRVHNSSLINMQHVNEYLKGEGGWVKMTDGSTVDVSRSRKTAFLNSFKKV